MDDRSGFRPATREDVTDHELLPRRFDLLAGEVRSLIQVLERKVVPAVERIVARLDDLDRDAGRAAVAIGEMRDRVDEMAQRLEAFT